jgi:Domain of unknown function (DUF4265)
MLRNQAMAKAKALERIPLKVDNLSISRESVLAEPSGGRRFVVRSIPAFVYGTAYGDEIELLNTDTGEFRVDNRGGQITIRVFLPGTLDRPEIDELIKVTTNWGGLYEIGRTARSDDESSLLLLSVPASIGFPKVEALMRDVSAFDGKWEYGNVYTQDGTPLNWWLT